MKTFFMYALMVSLNSPQVVTAATPRAPQPHIPQAGVYVWQPSLKLSLLYRTEVMDLRTVAGADRMKALQASGAVCEVLQATARCRVHGGSLSAAQQARATTLARDFLVRNFGTGEAPLMLASNPTAIQLVSEAPQLVQYTITQNGRMAGRSFADYSVFITADGTQKFQFLEHYWLKWAPQAEKLVHGFTLQFQERGPTAQVSWVVLAEATLDNR